MKRQAAFGEGPEESLPRLLRKSLFGEEPEKQRPAVPQDDGKIPNACPTQRETQTGGALNTHRQSREPGEQVRPERADLHFLECCGDTNPVLGLMNNLERISVRVQDISGVIARIVFEPGSRRDVVLCPGCYRRAIKIIDLSVVFGLEPPMD
jgi:hypothetical protein